MPVQSQKFIVAVLPMFATRQFDGAPQLDLILQVLASGGTVRLRVRGSSMLPSLWPGDVLIIEGQSCNKAVAGDIVLVLSDRRPLIHRIKEKHQHRNRRLQWVTQGDAVPECDPAVEESELVGRVSMIERNHRFIVPRRLSIWTRLLAWMLCHWDRLRCACLRVHAIRLSFAARREFVGG
jgi:signal peptidase I